MKRRRIYVDNKTGCEVSDDEVRARLTALCEDDFAEPSGEHGTGTVLSSISCIELCAQGFPPGCSYT